ncbi:fic family toxin-antitoxin system, toxin component (plasmid) [Streptomyces graminifolii]|uniref:fic family toxin-antitoxin system, toxin component n=1 Tax=Streptomyces graminifolii TaxID=1266771 RepID=UPI0040594E38
MIVRVDRQWLSEAARLMLPGDPDITDHGTFAAAVARHMDEVMDTLVYDQPHHRAAALMHQLIRVPGLENFNELFGVVVATSYLAASGIPVNPNPKAVADLAARINRGEVSVREVADEIRGWIGSN